MSDSDDTDFLLLIPPDFFLVDKTQDNSGSSVTPPLQYIMMNKSLQKNMLSSQNNKFPSSREQQDKTDPILSIIERNFSSPSEISTISNCTVKSRHRQQDEELLEFTSHKNMNPSTKQCFAHSTPINSGRVDGQFRDQHTTGQVRTHGIINEIDKFLQDARPENASMSSAGDLPKLQYFKEAGAKILPLEKCFSSGAPHSDCALCKSNNENEPLISLSQIWKNDVGSENLTLHEERLRRQHCEKTIQALQTKLLEYQQKLSVAIQVDRSKDRVINKKLEENSSLSKFVDNLKDHIKSMDARKEDFIARLQKDLVDLKAKKESLEQELAQALSLASKFQLKNEFLETKVENLTEASSQARGIYKKQVEDLEVRVLNSERREEVANEELNKAKVSLAKAEYDAEKYEKNNEDLRKEMSTLRNETEKLRELKKSLQEKAKEEKTRAGIYQQSLTEFGDKETQLLKELETQRSSLKAYYQQQLESVVEQKLKEFQSQLDSVEESLRNESKQRERLIASRAIKQLELVNYKNDQEIHLLQAKQREEVELYRIQLADASKTIENLQEKVNLYKSKRADIAEKLHNVMETQWQKALEILTCPGPNKYSNSFDAKNYNREKLDGAKKNDKTAERPENESFETPTSSRQRKDQNSDRLQAYIELLLKKSPRDLENLDEILQVAKHSQENLKTDYQRYHQQFNKTSDLKPPWK